MKLNLRHAIWAFALAITLAVFGASNFASAFQSERGLERGRGHDKDRNRSDNRGWDDDRNYTNNRNYQRGMNDGREDGRNNRNRTYRLRTNNDFDRRAYEAGYDQGYRDNSRNGNLAAQMGSQDGLNDGRQDRLTGHSNRPTQGNNYKNATRGFAGGDGQTAYKATYRQAYLPAYQQGYNEQINGRR